MVVGVPEKMASSKFSVIAGIVGKVVGLSRSEMCSCHQSFSGCKCHSHWELGRARADSTSGTENSNSDHLSFENGILDNNGPNIFSRPNNVLPFV